MRQCFIWQEYFNPRSREGSDGIEIVRSYKTKVISIHAPAKGATSFCASALCCHCHFNPRSREGSDNIRNRNIVFVIISIHAPAKGATVFPFSSTPLLNIFQSTLPRRERPATIKLVTAIFPFQSTLPRRERPRAFSVFPGSCIFQSTLPRRERPIS